MSMGIPGEVTHDSIKKIIRRIPEVTSKETGLGILATDLAAIKEYSGLGYNLMACGLDSQILNNGARQLLKEVRTSTR